ALKQPEYVFNVFRQCTEALAHAHKNNVVHRDIKPANIIVRQLDDGRVEAQIIDFGIAKMLSDESEQNLTQTGEMLGTPAYMSPEQCMGKDIRYASDVYSLASVAYEMLTGSPPFQGESAIAVIVKHINEYAPKMKRIRERPGFELIINKALERDQAQRYQSARDMLEDVERVHRGERPRARTSVLRECSRRWKMSSAVTKMTVVAALLTAVIGAPIGLSKFNSANRSDTMKAIEAQLQVNPKTYDEHVRLARQCRLRGMYGRVLSIAEQAITINRDRHEAYVLKAEAKARQGDMVQALAAADRAIQLNPKDSEAFHWRGFVHLQKGDPVTALNDLNQAISLAPNDANLRLDRAILYCHTNNYEPALADLDHAISMADPPSAAYYQRASVRFSMKDHKGTESDITKFLELKPDSPIGLELHMRNLLALGSSAEAMDTANRVLAINPNSAEAHIIKSKIFRSQGKIEQADTEGEQAFQLDPVLTRHSLEECRIKRPLEPLVGTSKEATLQEVLKMVQTMAKPA
ncbi:MAG: tetratricopeptide repeat protein, partial [Cyanobacteria bacterium]|nr:tetratricopeptide repeat protein [Cyanobacteriota bacterium]